MNELLERFKHKKPSIVFHWSDEETDAEGWIVINSLRGGAAGGGTRMRKGLDQGEVAALAKIMEIKFSISGPPIGGAKSGINFDPADPRKKSVLERWFKFATPILKHYYGTGGDLNIDEVHEVIPITESFGLWHPQEGVVNGHLNVQGSGKIKIIGQLRLGVSKKIEDLKYSPDLKKKYVVADLITGWGVSESIKHYYKIFHKKNLKGKRAIIQGWGNVAGAAAYYLSKMGVKIVAILDRHGGLIDDKGMSHEKVKSLFVNRHKNSLVSEDLMSYEEVMEKAWKIQTDIFLPGAASRLVRMDHAKALISNGCEVISCGANVPFSEEDMFYGPIADYVDANCSLIPDFVANCGMARVFAYLMQPGIEISDEAIFNDTSSIIYEALDKVYSNNNKSDKYITKTALDSALRNLI